MDKKIKLFSIKKEHESAAKHGSGKAKYIDDIPEPKNLLHAATGYSQIAKGKSKSINLKEVTKSEGVNDVITYKDIPGINDVGPVFSGDPIFPLKTIEYYGQPLFAVAATSTELARKAALKAKITYKELKPIIEIKDALKKKSYILKSKTISKGDPTLKISKAKNFLKGNFTTGNQEHFI